jgi:drug/metabolite transporter (DMT)-like permease
VAGTLCCAVSAVTYTVASICMRQLRAIGCDPMWATCTKEAVTVAVVGPWLLSEALRGRRVLPPWPMLATLLLVGLAVQWGGNLCSQWAYGFVGLGIVISANFGAALTAATVLGRLFLGERVSPRSAASVALLLASLGLLALGAEGAGKAISPHAGPWLIALAVGAACTAGVIYAVLSITIRHAVTGTTRLSLLVVAITGMGVLTLGPTTVSRLGVAHLLGTPPEHLAWMAAAGIFNLIGFLSITKGLQLTTVVHANVLNASQVAMAAVAGVVIFREPPNPWLTLGVCLTLLGILLIGRPADGIRIAQQGQAPDWMVDTHV